MEKIFSNHLAEESSPYLLQHAHNPVEWYPWGEEALQRAKDEDKPILVSIGYAACHWCHVMERESFEDEGTAEIMNRYFINIKIDREERPDLDHIYMDAVQAISGSGGWPLNVFLTPDKKPFYGGTYYPPIQAYNRSSWKEVLTNVHQLFVEKRHEVEAQAENLTNHLLDSNAFGINTKLSEEANEFSKENLQLIADNILKQADKIEGGFGKAPKFPQTFSIQYLLRHYHFTKDKKALKQALLSLDKMIYGGIYDQLGGGFARYSTDAEWLAPHFEKMLYDNALLINVLAEAYQVTNNPLYANTIEHTLAFIEREMQSEEGGFYSALDADSEGVEGKFYVWSKEEIEEILGEESNLFCAYYDVTKEGNWEHTNILRVQKPLDLFALEHNYQEATLESRLNRAKELLIKQRNKRIRPQLDDKILLGWNALMVTAYCKAYAATGKKQYKATAEVVFSFLEAKFRNEDGSFLHTYKKGEAKINAFLDDYAYFIQTCIAMQEITGKAQYLDKAKKIADFVIQHFSDDGSGLFYYTSEKQADIIVRKKELYDGAVPSGNAIMIGNLHYLSIIYQDTKWRQRVEMTIRSLVKAIVNHPTSFGVWAGLLQSLTFGTKEIVLTGAYILKELPKMLKKYVPNKILQIAIKEMENYPLLAGKLVEEETICYLCENETCHETIFSLDDFLNYF